MIVTRSWLNEYIDLSNTSNDELYETFNSIGLEVDSFKTIDIDDNIVVGKIVSCQKHPDADKLNVCSIDIGSGILKQIVCGASNVVDATYVAVAKVGAMLPGEFVIKDATLRGVDSAGMVCSASEIGLPDIGNGIMILDDSIGELKEGNKLSSYPNIADTIIELELTANRGDCLSVLGVARDLSSALNIDIKDKTFSGDKALHVGISKVAEIVDEGNNSADLEYRLFNADIINTTLLIDLRLAMVNLENQSNIDKLLAYSTHETGIILRAYNIEDVDVKNKISIKSTKEGIVDVFINDLHASIVGVSQDDKSMTNNESSNILVEASYIHPDTLVEAVHSGKYECDDLYYKTSRGSSNNLDTGLNLLSSFICSMVDSDHYEGSLGVSIERSNENIKVDINELSSIVGMDISLEKAINILNKLDFETTHASSEIILAKVPLYRHDIKHIQDISEEIVRIIGINNIESKSLSFEEKPRLNSTTDLYKAKKEFKNRAVGASFYENMSYIFTDKQALQKYGFTTVKEELELTNPIAEDLNTLRSTILINLLNAVKRNVSYSIKSIPLFEMGSVFDENRVQTDVLSFVFSGINDSENVTNAGKPLQIDFPSFVKKVGSVIGEFELVKCSANNKLIHPYQSADVIIDGVVCGFIAKLHPTVQEEFGIYDTFIAEVSMDSFLPKHVNSKSISKYQGVTKDLSIVLSKEITFSAVFDVINKMDLDLLKSIYPIDVYEDEKLGTNKSLTIRFVLQSPDRTLEEVDIEDSMNKIIENIETSFNAQLR